MKNARRRRPVFSRRKPQSLQRRARRRHRLMMGRAACFDSASRERSNKRRHTPRRGIQYAAAFRSITIESEYWIARSSRAMTAEDDGSRRAQSNKNLQRGMLQQHDGL